MKASITNFQLNILFVSLAPLEFEAQAGHICIEPFKSIDMFFFAELLRKHHVIAERDAFEYFHNLFDRESSDAASDLGYIENLIGIVPCIVCESPYRSRQFLGRHLVHMFIERRDSVGLAL